MPRPLDTVCHASRSHLTKKARSAHIWVSDELLSDTFNTFARNHKRHGSNVPGPLEAQRRTAKRRTTNIAHSTPYGPGFQPFEMFGARPKDGWWDRPTPSEHNLTQSSSWLWSFLSPQTGQSPTYLPPRPQNLNTPEVATELVQTDGFKSAEERLQERLGQIRTQEALMGLLADLSVDLTPKPYLTRIMLRHILANNWDREQLAEFLLEPRTNPSGSGNHAYLFQHFQEHRSITIWLIQRRVYFKAAQLGLLDVSDLHAILLLAPSLRLNNPTHCSGEAASSQHDFAWASFSVDLLGATEASKVIHLKDLGQSFVRQWCQAIENQEFQPDMPQLLWKLYEFLGHSISDGFQRVLRQSIQATSIASLCHLPKLVDFALSRPYKDLTKVLLPVTMDFVTGAKTTISPLDDCVHDEEEELFRQALTTTVLKHRESGRSALCRPVSESESSAGYIQPFTDGVEDYLVARGSPELGRSPSGLEKWYAFLSVLNTPSFPSFKIDQKFFKHRFRSKKFDLQEQQKFIIQLWITAALSEHNYTAVESLEKLSASTMSQQFSHRSDVRTEDMLVDLLVTLRSLPLPAKHRVLRRAGYFSRGFLVVKRNYADLVRCMDDLHDGRILGLRDDRYYRMAQFHFPALLTQVVESMNADMTNFEATCRTLIRETKEGAGLVYRLLKHNRSVQFALRHLATLTFSYPFRWDNEKAAQKPAVGDYSYNQVVDMINNFAMECAKSPISSPRAALRQVFLFYQLLHRYRAPIKPAILEALWVAGVMRYSGASSMTVVSWLHDRLVQYVGKDIAKVYLDRTILHDRYTKRMAAIRERIIEQESKLQRSGCSLHSSSELPPAGIPSVELENVNVNVIVSAPGGKEDSLFPHHADSSEVSCGNSLSDTARQGQTGEHSSFRPMQMVSDTAMAAISDPGYFVKRLDLSSETIDDFRISEVSDRQLANCDSAIAETTLRSDVGAESLEMSDRKPKPVDHLDDQLQARRVWDSLQHDMAPTPGTSSKSEEHNKTLNYVAKSELTLSHSEQIDLVHCIRQENDASESKLLTTLGPKSHPDVSTVTLSSEQEAIEPRSLPDISKLETPISAAAEPHSESGSAPYRVLSGFNASESEMLTLADHEPQAKYFTTTPDPERESGETTTATSTPDLQPSGNAPLVALAPHSVLEFLSQAEQDLTSNATAKPEPASSPTPLIWGSPLSQALTSERSLIPTATVEPSGPPFIRVGKEELPTVQTSTDPVRRTKKNRKEVNLIRYHDVMSIRKFEHELSETGSDVPIAEGDRYTGYRERIKARIVHEAKLRKKLGGVKGKMDKKDD